MQTLYVIRLFDTALTIGSQSGGCGESLFKATDRLWRGTISSSIGFIYHHISLLWKPFLDHSGLRVLSGWEQNPRESSGEPQQCADAHEAIFVYVRHRWFRLRSAWNGTAAFNSVLEEREASRQASFPTQFAILCALQDGRCGGWGRSSFRSLVFIFILVGAGPAGDECVGPSNDIFPSSRHACQGFSSTTGQQHLGDRYVICPNAYEPVAVIENQCTNSKVHTTEAHSTFTSSPEQLSF